MSANQSELASFRLFSTNDDNKPQLGFSFLDDSPEKLSILPPNLPPCLEVLPSQISSSVKPTLEPVNLDGLTLLKGRVSTNDVFALSNSDLVPGKYEGGLKLWEGSLDLVKTLRSEVESNNLSFVGMKVLELGCGHGLPGIYSCLQGASAVHFQDFNSEVLQCLTIPNVVANLPVKCQSPGADAEVRFFAGDWSEVHQILPNFQTDDQHSNCSSGSSASIGYDIIVMAETVYSISTLPALYELIKKCMRRPHGVVYMAAKKYYFGVGGGSRRFISLVEKDGVMVATLITEVGGGSSNVREIWRLQFNHQKILIVAYPGIGHINPALRLANRLLKMGVNITFCASLSVIQRIDKETGPQGLTFAPFSDGHDTGKHPNTTLQQFVSDFETNGAPAVAEIISSAMGAAQPFDCLVYTTGVPWAARVASAYSIKSALLWCQSATVLDIYYYYFNGYQGLISSNDNSAFPINLPGLPSLTIADLPLILLSSCPKEHEFFVPIIKDHLDVLKIAPSVLVNTANELEIESVQAIEKLEFLSIGPLVPSDGKDSMDFFEKTADGYLQWLNTQPKSSVVYVSFGTIATFRMEQLEEMAIGLLEICRPFLWVIRDGEQAERLRKIAGLQKQGMIVGWCSQVEVLKHQAIGCVVMHCGWNSTLEVLMAGVPTVAFPQWTDQALNARLIEDLWKTGVRVRTREGDGMVEGKEIKRCVEMVMEDQQMKINAAKWQAVTREALNNGGSSTTNLQAFLHHL